MQRHASHSSDVAARSDQRVPRGEALSSSIPVSASGAALPCHDAHLRCAISDFEEAVLSGVAASSKTATQTELNHNGNGNNINAHLKRASNPQPFLKQRRLPSILMDSWEFRKLAAEGSVMANAMVSYDVDDDGVEEVIVGTTEGLLCVVKPDCRAPLFLRVLAATISVVLYTPIRKRLVLITLEGQCEVIDYFLSPNGRQQQQLGCPCTSWCGADGDVYQRSDGANTLLRGTTVNNTGNGSNAYFNASPSTEASQPRSARNSLGGLLSGSSNSNIAALPRNRSHTSVFNPLLYEAASQPAPPPTHVFHVPSNCLCADLSTDTDTDLVFLGSYDRRFYVYAVATGSCLLSLFVHDPITSVRTFTIPTAAAQDRKATTSSSFISVYDRSGKHGAGKAHRRVSSVRGESSSPLSHESCSRSTKLLTPRSDLSTSVSTHTVEYRSPDPNSSLYIPLVFLATPTHLILLPAGMNEIQQWRKLQLKSAHLPLTVQLHADTPSTLPLLANTQVKNHNKKVAAGTAGLALSSTEAAGLKQKLSGSVGGDPPFRPSTAATLNVSTSRTVSASGRSGTMSSTLNNEIKDGGAGFLGAHAGSAGVGRISLQGSSASPQQEGETPVPSSSSLVNVGDVKAGSSNTNTRNNSRGLCDPLDRPLAAEINSGLLSSENDNNNNSNAASAASTVRDCGAVGVEVNVPLNPESAVPLSTSQQRRQSRKLAIQAAEMGKPVLVKPLWVLRIGNHTLDVLPLQTSPIPPQGLQKDAAAPTKATMAATASDMNAEAVSGSDTRRAGISTVSVNSMENHCGSPPAASEHQQHRHLQQHHSHLHRSRSSHPCRTLSRGNSPSLLSLSSRPLASGLREGSDVLVNSVTQSCTGLPEEWRSVLSSREEGEETVASAVVASAVTGATLERSGSRHGPLSARRARRPQCLQSVRASSVTASNSTRDSSGDGEVGSNSRSCNGSDRDEGNDVARRRRRGEGSCRHRRSFSRGGGANCIEEPSDGVQFSLSAEEGDGPGLRGSGMQQAVHNAEERERRCESAGEKDAYERSSADSEGCALSFDNDNAHNNSSTSFTSDDCDDNSDSCSDYSAEDGQSCSGGHNRGIQPKVDPWLLAKSNAWMRAESVPTTLLRRLIGDSNTSSSATPGVDSKGAAAQGPYNQNNNMGVRVAGLNTRGGLHTSLVDLANLDKRHGRRRHRRTGSAMRSSQLKHDDVIEGLASGVGTDASDVRLPTSVDVSVGASQVAVALCCEDGLAFELRFTMEKLSALSRRACHSTGRPVRLYDLRHPPCPRQILGQKMQTLVNINGSISRHYQLGDSLQGGEVSLGRQIPSSSSEQQQQLCRPASSPSSPKHARSFSGVDISGLHCNSPHPGRHHRASRGSGGRCSGTEGRRPTSIIYLPLPAPRPAMSTSSMSPLLPSLACAPHGQNNVKNNVSNVATHANVGIGDSFNTAAVAAAPEPGGETSSNAVSRSSLQCPSSTPASATNTTETFRGRKKQQHQQQRSQSRRSLHTPTPTLPSSGGGGNDTGVGDSLHCRRYEEDAVVLRAQCLWAAQLGDSPLVQRARVFCVKDHHQDNTFCTVFVAANGTCFAIDGDTLSVVECAVKEDCSSFTLMAGPSSTMPLPFQLQLQRQPPSDASAFGTFSTTPGSCNNTTGQSTGGKRAGGGHDNSSGAKAEDALYEGIAPAEAVMNANLLRGAVGRTVSCVCVSVDELCIYSVGEANQLVQHRDAAQLVATPMSDVMEPTSLLSRRPRNNPCTSTAVLKIGDPVQTSDGESIAYLRPQQYQVDHISCAGNVDESLSAVELEEKALLRVLARRLKEQEKHLGAAATSPSTEGEGEVDDEAEETMLLRVKQLLLYSYSYAEWEKLKWLDHGVT